MKTPRRLMLWCRYFQSYDRIYACFLNKIKLSLDTYVTLCIYILYMTDILKIFCIISGHVVKCDNLMVISSYITISPQEGFCSSPCSRLCLSGAIMLFILSLVLAYDTEPSLTSETCLLCQLVTRSLP